MATEREIALGAVIPESLTSEPPKLEKAILEASVAAHQTRQLELTQAHEIEKLRAELGWFGVVFGSEAHASIVVAFVVVILGFLGAIGLWSVAYATGHPEFWTSEAHVSLAAATSALGYVFGRGSRDNHKP